MSNALTGMDVADIDRDGILDVAISVDDADRILLLTGACAGTFKSNVRFYRATARGWALRIADMDGDLISRRDPHGQVNESLRLLRNRSLP